MSVDSDNGFDLPSRAAKDGKESESSVEGGEEEVPFTRAELRALSDEIPDRLPAEGDRETRLVLVDIDPCHVHVYWHIRREDIESAGGAARSQSEPRLLLRLHDALCSVMVGFIPWPPLEFEVSGLDGYKYVEIPDCGKTLIAELGLLGVNGGFTRLASSHPVRLPRASRDTAEIPERVELVLIDEPGIPPRVVEVVPPATAPSLCANTEAGRQSASAPNLEAPGISPTAISRDGSRVPPSSPLVLSCLSYFGTGYQAEPWYWSGGPIPGFSGGEPD